MPSSQVTQQSRLVFFPPFQWTFSVTWHFMEQRLTFGGKLRDLVLSFGQILNITAWNVDRLKCTRCCSTYQQTHIHWYPSAKSLQWAWFASWMWRLLRLRRMRRISDFNAFITRSWCISTYQAHAQYEHCTMFKPGKKLMTKTPSDDSLLLFSWHMDPRVKRAGTIKSFASSGRVVTLMALTEHLRSQPIASLAFCGPQAGRSALLFTFSRNYKFSAIQ